jgi:uncharacterized Ntn-hydrolase superfamily protein
VAGNMLAGPAVIQATAQAFLARAAATSPSACSPPWRRARPPAATSAASRARPCASTADEDYPQLDLRVDDHEEPLRELERLYRKSLERYQPFMACLAGRHDPVGIIDRPQIEARIARFQRERGSAG